METDAKPETANWAFQDFAIGGLGPRSRPIVFRASSRLISSDNASSPATDSAVRSPGLDILSRYSSQLSPKELSQLAHLISIRTQNKRASKVGVQGSLGISKRYKSKNSKFPWVSADTGLSHKNHSFPTRFDENAVEVLKSSPGPGHLQVTSTERTEGCSGSAYHVFRMVENSRSILPLTPPTFNAKNVEKTSPEQISSSCVEVARPPPLETLTGFGSQEANHEVVAKSQLSRFVQAKSSIHSLMTLIPFEDMSTLFSALWHDDAGCSMRVYTSLLSSLSTIGYDNKPGELKFPTTVIPSHSNRPGNLTSNGISELRNRAEAFSEGSELLNERATDTLSTDSNNNTNNVKGDDAIANKSRTSSPVDSNYGSLIQELTPRGSPNKASLEFMMN